MLTLLITYSNGHQDIWERVRDDACLLCISRDVGPGKSIISAEIIKYEP